MLRRIPQERLGSKRSNPESWILNWCFGLAQNNTKIILSIVCISSDRCDTIISVKLDRCESVHGYIDNISQQTESCYRIKIETTITQKTSYKRRLKHERTSYSCVQMASMKDTCMLGILSLFSRFIRSWPEGEREIRFNCKNVPDISRADGATNLFVIR